MGRIIHILLVEDSEDDALFFRMGLRDTNSNLVHVESAEAAIIQLQTRPLPDLIVMDLRLQGMPVTTFLEWLRSIPQAQTVPVVVYTGAVKVPDDVKNAVHQVFFKSLDLKANRQTALEIVHEAGSTESKTGV